MALYLGGGSAATPKKKKTTAADIAHNKRILAMPNAPKKVPQSPIPARTAASYGHTNRASSPLQTININGNFLNQAPHPAVKAYQNLMNQVKKSNYFSSLVGLGTGTTLPGQGTAPTNDVINKYVSSLSGANTAFNGIGLTGIFGPGLSNIPSNQDYAQMVLNSINNRSNDNATMTNVINALNNNTYGTTSAGNFIGSNMRNSTTNDLGSQVKQRLLAGQPGWYDPSSNVTMEGQWLGNNWQQLAENTLSFLSTPQRSIQQTLYNMVSGLAAPFYNMDKALGLSRDGSASNSMFNLSDPGKQLQMLLQATGQGQYQMPQNPALVDRGSGINYPDVSDNWQNIKNTQSSQTPNILTGTIPDAVLKKWEAQRSTQQKGLSKLETETAKEEGGGTPKGGGTGTPWWEQLGFSSEAEANQWLAMQNTPGFEEGTEEDWGMYGEGGYDQSQSALDLAKEYADWQRTMQVNDVNMQIDSMLRALKEEQGRVDPYYNQLLSQLGVTRDASMSGQQAALDAINKNYERQRLSLTDTTQAAKEAAQENALATGTLDSGKTTRANRRIDQTMGQALAEVMGNQSASVNDINQALAGVQNQYADTITSTNQEKANYLKTLAQKMTDYENQRGQQIFNIGEELNAYTPVLARQIQTDMNNYNLQAAAQAFNQKLAQQNYNLSAADQAFNQQMAMMNYNLAASGVGSGGGGSYMSPSQALAYQKYYDEQNAAMQPNYQGVIDLIGQMNANPSSVGLIQAFSPYFSGALNTDVNSILGTYNNYMNQNTVQQQPNMWQQFLGLFRR